MSDLALSLYQKPAQLTTKPGKHNPLPLPDGLYEQPDSSRLNVSWLRYNRRKYSNTGYNKITKTDNKKDWVYDVWKHSPLGNIIGLFHMYPTATFPISLSYNGSASVIH